MVMLMVVLLVLMMMMLMMLLRMMVTAMVMTSLLGAWQEPVRSVTGTSTSTCLTTTVRWYLGET
jgi:hypothetical protein